MQENQSIVHYRLVDGNGQPYKKCRPSYAELLPNQFVGQLKDHVKAVLNYPGYLENIPALALQVFDSLQNFEKHKNRADSDNNDYELANTRVLGNLGRSERTPLIVMVPTDEPKLDMSYVMRHYDAYLRYRYIGRQMVDKMETQDLLVLIEKLRNFNNIEEKVEIPFIFVEGSSGTGKTQMAFTLREKYDENEFFYLLGSRLNNSSQSIYLYHENIVRSFMECADRDLSNIEGTSDGFSCLELNRQSLYIYGFICEMLSGKYGSNARFYANKKTFADMDRLLQGKKRPIVVLDEFSWNLRINQAGDSKDADNKSENWLRLLRNSFRSAGFVVILMGTEARAANMIDVSTQSRGHDDINSPWCHVFIGLPKVNLPALDKNQMISKIADDTIREIVSFILSNSRPLFAKYALNYIDNNLAGFNLNEMVKYVYNRSVSAKRMEYYTESHIGQLIMTLNAMYSAKSKSTPLIHRHFARLYVEDKHITDHYFCINCECKFLPSSIETWKPSSVFPRLEEDLLLHLSFLGIGEYNPMFYQENKCPYRALAEYYTLGSQKINDTINLNWLKNSNQKSDDGNYFEAILTGSLCLASHYGGMDGNTLSNVLSWLAYHLSTNIDLEIPSAIDNMDLLGNFREYKFPVLSTPGNKWPAVLGKRYPLLADFDRTINAEKIDVSAQIIGKPSAYSFSHVTGEAKFRTRNIGSGIICDILKRIPLESQCHFILTTPIISREIKFEGGSFESFATSHNLDNALILRMKINANQMKPSLSRISGINCKVGTERRPFKFNKIVLFVECCGGDSLPEES